MALTPNLGFQLRPDGDMIFGKDLNEVILDIDDKLGQALGKMSEAGAAAAVAVGSAAWTQLVLDNEQEIVFATEVELKGARFVVTNAGAIGGNSVDLALALASAPGTPITGGATFTTAGGDTVVAPTVGLSAIPATEEIIVIEKDTADTGWGPSAIDVQVVVEVQKTTT